ncbi:tumor necrosis factor receptor superfamily member 16 [Exaiptasia diaphana]|uniref:TNFR-Cys domain-containing protein n=1 Tax=Exaiptasia diaphana TaxID=2652724 RepID=A0A913YM12_EXADI|nr:tumor necrosis factor receptor superfamily member 16 [Exaiptasia diaphana]KXJ25854.1 hypothetical protein AC249_AIPGENE27650 [Exaiptasia diaphana]
MTQEARDQFCRESWDMGKPLVYDTERSIEKTYEKASLYWKTSFKLETVELTRWRNNKRDTLGMANKKQIRKLAGRVLCAANEIAVWKKNTNNTVCQVCPKCRRAHGLNHACGTVLKTKDLTSPIRCERCIKGRTYSPKKSTDMCKLCTICQENREVERRCTRRNDTICGKCKKKHYEERHDFGFNSCEKCSQCCGDGKDKIEQQCVDQGLPSDKVCSYLDAERCKKHKDPSVKISTTPSKLPGLTSPMPILLRLQPNTSETTSTYRSPQQYIINNNNVNNNNVNTGPNTLGLKAGISSVGLVLLLSLVAACLYKKWRRKRRKSHSGIQSPGNDSEAPDPQTIPLRHLDESAKVTSYLDDPETYRTNGPYEQICDHLNKLKYKDFEAVCIRLRIQRRKVRNFYPHEGIGKFEEVLTTLSSENTKVTLKDIARACERHQCVVDLLRSEDRRLRNTQRIIDEETVVE